MGTIARSTVLLMVFSILVAQACRDTTVISFEQPGGSASLDTDSGVDTDTVDTDKVDTDTTECESTYRDALVCTGFEDGITLDTHNVMGGSLETVSSPVFEGRASLHAAVDGDRNYANVSGRFDPFFEGSLYFRAYYYIAAADFTGNIKLAAFEGYDPLSEYDEENIDFMATEGGKLFVYLHEPQQIASVYESETGVLPTNTWFCLRGAVEISDTEGVITYGIGDADLVSATGLDTLTVNGVSWADFGVGWTDGVTSAIDVYVDNIVVDTSPVPCSP
jgi:hypothetical protein